MSSITLAGSREPVAASVSVPDEEVASYLAHELVDRRLAACVQVVGPIRSVYRWDGAVEDERELLLIVKTTRDRIEEIEALLRTDHPYEVPELVAVPIVAGGRDYLEWLAASVE